jgi:hypothetical protein
MMQHQRQNHIAHAATLNNIAASFLHVGDYSTAVAQFTEALKAIQKYKGVAEPDNNMANLVSLDDCMIHSYPIVIHTDKRECSHDDHENNQGEPTSILYRHAILLPSKAFESSVGNGTHDDYSASVVTSVAVLFNLALVHHLAAIHQEVKSNKRSSQLAKVQLGDKAVKLCQLAMSCCQDLESLSTWDEFLLFSMKTINNMAMALKKLQQKERSRECVLELLSLVILVVDLGTLDPTIMSFCHGFFRNTCHLVGQQITAVAA